MPIEPRDWPGRNKKFPVWAGQFLVCIHFVMQANTKWVAKQYCFFDRQTCIFYHKHIFHILLTRQREKKNKKKRKVKHIKHAFHEHLSEVLHSWRNDVLWCQKLYTPQTCIIMSKRNTLFEQVQQDRSFFKNLKWIEA